MDGKKTFGAFVLRRRKELGMTQKEFAQRLFVTESAVSKWERGLSYPDITMLRSICETLGVTEHELLTGSEDSERRTAQRLAGKYLRMTKRWRILQYIAYGAIIAGCFLGNILSEHMLSWFFIALTACMTAASVTLAPLIFSARPQTEGMTLPLSAACFTVSLVLLLTAGCAYSGGDWYFVGITGALLGAAAFILPCIMKKLPLGEFWQERKTSLWLIVNTALLILLLFASCAFSGGDWFLIASVSTIFGLGFIIVPVLLRQMPLPENIARHKTLLLFAVQTAGLYILLFVADRYARAGAFFTVSLPVSGISLLLPWTIMLICRYLRADVHIRTALSLAAAAAWLYLFPKGMETILVHALAIDQGQISIPKGPLHAVIAALCLLAAVSASLHFARRQRMK